MPKARYLAPWHQADVWDLLKPGPGSGPTLSGGGVELSDAALRKLKGKPAIYHCVSRVVDRRFVFGDREKEQFISYMRLYEQYCQVRALSFCIMSNHFHILLEVPAPPEDHGRSWPDAKFLEHLRILYSGPALRTIETDLARFRAQRNIEGAEKLRERHFRRMWDLSQFMKTLKQRFTRWFNKERARTGTLWEERFKSTLVQDGLAARSVAAYIDLNPVRAGILAHPDDYPWSSLGTALAGDQRSREGLQRVMFERERHATSDEHASEMLLSWRKAIGRYRELLSIDQCPEKLDPDAAIAATRPVTDAELLRTRVRHFTEGLVLGTRAFVDQSWALTRSYFGSHRKSGARRIRHACTPLCAMRDLRPRPASRPDQKK